MATGPCAGTRVLAGQELEYGWRLSIGVPVEVAGAGPDCRRDGRGPAGEAVPLELAVSRARSATRLAVESLFLPPSNTTMRR